MSQPIIVNHYEFISGAQSQLLVELRLQFFNRGLVQLDHPVLVLELSLESLHLLSLLGGVAVLSTEHLGLILPVFQLRDFGDDKVEVLILARKFLDDGFKRVEFLFVVLLQFVERKLIVVLVLLEGLLEVSHFPLVTVLHVLERLDKFLQDVDQAFSFLLVHDDRLLLVGRLGFLLVGELDLTTQVLNLVVEGIDGVLHLLHLLVLAVLLLVLVVELLNGLGEFGVDLDQFLQRLLEQVVLLLELSDTLPQLDQLILSCEVVLEFLGHPGDQI